MNIEIGKTYWVGSRLNSPSLAKVISINGRYAKIATIPANGCRYDVIIDGNSWEPYRNG